MFDIKIASKILDGDKTLATLQSIQKVVNEISGHAVTIKFNIVGLDNVSVNKMSEIRKAIKELSKVELTNTKTEIAKIKADTAEINKQTAEIKKNTAEINNQKAAKSLSSAMAKTASATGEAATATRSYGTNAAFAALKSDFLASIVINQLTAAFQQALSTMKDVDSELVTIQKVTDFSAEKIATLTENAYSMASAYGRTATEVLKAETAFAQAGYGEKIEQMAEMSTLVQNVGDIGAETANKFLLSADAAWKLGGDVAKLTAIIDGMNEVTNKNATDMQKLAEGITVAGNVFAVAGESAQSFTALLGAATAATQRSGSEVARGLRTILMNIRQIEGETEDGELINGESWSKAAKALREYADINTMANGALRSTMDILGELAGKWETLNSTQREAIGQAVGGKRQANILYAVVENWHNVQKMMEEYAGAAGSALKENELYLNSWEAKSQQLNATWTQFVSHLVDTGAIKGLLDVLRGIVMALDNWVGRGIIVTASVVALSTAVLGLVGKIKMALESVKSVVNISSVLNWKFVAIAAAIYAVVTAIQYLKDAFPTAFEQMEDAVASMREAQTAIDDLTEKINTNTQEIARLRADGSGGHENEIRALEDKNRQLEIELELKRKIREEENQKAITAWNEAASGIFNGGYGALSLDNRIFRYTTARGADTRSEASMRGAMVKLGHTEESAAGFNYGALKTLIENAVETGEQGLKDTLSQLMEMSDEARELGIAEGEVYDQLTEYIQLLGEVLYTAPGAVDGAGEGATAENVKNLETAITEAQTAVKEYSSALDELQDTYQSLTSIQDQYNQTGYITLDSFQKLMDMSPEYLATLQNTGNGVWFNEEAYNAVTEAMIINMANAKKMEVVKQASKLAAEGNTEALDRLATATLGHADAVLSENKALLENAAIQGLTDAQYAGLMAQLQSIDRWAKAAQTGIKRYTRAAYGAATATKAVAKATKEVKEIKPNDAWNDVKKAFDAILSLYKDNVQAQKDAIQEQIDALETARDAEEEALELEEKKLAVLEAQDALLNARNNRTVKVWNEDTQQFEWVADAGDVKSAEEALAKAQKDLDDYQSGKAHDAQIKALKNQQDALDAQYDAFKDEWNKIQQSLKTPAQDMVDALDKIATYGTPKMLEQVLRINSILGLMGYTGNDLTLADSMKSAVLSGLSGSGGTAATLRQMAGTTSASHVTNNGGNTYNTGTTYVINGIQISQSDATAKTLAELFSTLPIYTNGG